MVIKKQFLLSCLCILSGTLSAMSYNNSFGVLTEETSDAEKATLALRQKNREYKLGCILNKDLFSWAKDGKLVEIKELFAKIKPQIENDLALQAIFHEKIQSPFLAAARYGKTDVANYLLEEGAEIDRQDENGATALCCAAGRGYKETVLFLLEKGADVNAGAKPALLWATGSGYPEIVTKLLEHKASTTARDDKGNTALHWAASTGITDKNNPRTEQKKADYEQCFESLFTANPRSIVCKSESGMYPLHSAVIGGSIKAVTLILERAQQDDALAKMINAQDSESLRTPLMWVARMANKQAEKLMVSHPSETSIALRDILLSYGADPKIKDKTKKTAYFWFKEVGLPLPNSPADSNDDWHTASRSQASSSRTQFAPYKPHFNNCPAQLERKPGGYIPPSLRNKNK